MTFKTTFPSDISQEKSQLILSTLKKCKTSGYTLSLQLRKVRQIYHPNLGKDKVDSIKTFLDKNAVPYTMLVK